MHAISKLHKSIDCIDTRSINKKSDFIDGVHKRGKHFSRLQNSFKYPNLLITGVKMLYVIHETIEP